MKHISNFLHMSPVEVAIVAGIILNQSKQTKQY